MVDHQKLFNNARREWGRFHRIAGDLPPGSVTPWTVVVSNDGDRRFLSAPMVEVPTTAPHEVWCAAMRYNNAAAVLNLVGQLCPFCVDE